MSLLRRLEGRGAAPSGRPGEEGAEAPEAPPERPAAPPPPPASPPPPERRGLMATPAVATAEVGAPRGSKAWIRELKGRVQGRLIKELDPKLDVNDKDKVRQVVQQLFDKIMEEENTLLPRAERINLFDALLAEIIGFGPIQPLLDDESVSEVMVNGPNRVFCERKGKLELTDIKFDDEAHARRIIERIVSPLGRRCDESSPLVDARLPDGSRVNAIIPPLALDGATITIRKFSKKPLSVDDLIRFGSLTPELAEFLQACVVARFNIVVSGGTGSGKTTLLNVLSSFIPEDERIITIEDAAELQLQQIHWVRLESRKANIEGKGAVTIRDLVMNTLRMRPDRIVVGECRGGEALDMIQAMNTGHDGSLTTLHANTPKDALGRLEVLVLMAGMDLPVRAIRQQVASALQLIVQQERLRDGSRRVTYVTEVQGMEGDTVVLQDIFLYEQTGIDSNGKIIGHVRPTGLRPKYMQKITDAGIQLPANIFGGQPSRG
ncbi:MAG: CpaF family protein [Chloroflexi bacterium]|nr:CpaF family protein [Chloroflexota bacterium]